MRTAKEEGEGGGGGGEEIDETDLRGRFDAAFVWKSGGSGVGHGEEERRKEEKLTHGEGKDDAERRGSVGNSASFHRGPGSSARYVEGCWLGHVTRRTSSGLRI